MRLSLAQKILFFVFTFIALIMGSVVASGYLMDKISLKLVDLSEESSEKLGLSFQIIQSVSSTSSSVQEVLRQKDADEIEKSIDHVTAKRTELKKSLEQCGAACDDIKANIIELNSDHEKAIRLLLEGNVSDAYEFFANEVSRKEGKVLTAVNSFSTAVKTELGKKATETLNEAAALKNLSIVVAGGVGIVMMVGGFLFTRSFKNRLSKTSRSLEIISRGNFAERLDTTVDDELGQVGKVVNHMASEISTLVRSIEEKNASLKSLNEGLESEVLARTHTIRTIVDNVKSGFFVLGTDLKIQPGYTKSCVDLFDGRWREDVPFVEVVSLDKRDAENFAFLARQVFDDFLPEDLSLSQMPERFPIGKRILNVKGSAIRSASGAVDSILFTVSDVTSLEAAQNENAKMRVIFEIQRNEAGFTAFLGEFGTTFSQARLKITTAGDRGGLRQALHTLKGNSASFGLAGVAQLIHHIEGKEVIEASDLDAIRSEMERFLEDHRAFVKIDPASVFAEGGVKQLSGAIVKIPNVHMAELSAILRASSVDYPDMRLLRGWMSVANMVPAANLLGNIEPEARKLSERLGKNVKFDISGLETPIDPACAGKTLQNVIHLVRNAIDHGLEIPEERGVKPALAHLSVRVLEVSDAWFVVVEDDGKGIDPVRVGQAALKKGLVTEKSLENMSDADKIRLIFLEDLSTSESATDISGRGIGMSAVAQSVAEVGGTINIHSRKGEGTRFEIRLPLPVEVLDWKGAPQRRSVPLAS